MSLVICHHKISWKILNPVVEQTPPIFLSMSQHKNDLNEEHMRLEIEVENHDDHVLFGNYRPKEDELNDIYDELSDEAILENKNDKFHSLAIKCCESDNINVLMQIFEHNKS